MRWAVVFLVVTNLAVYFWLTQNQKTESQKQYSKQVINVDYETVSSLRMLEEPVQPVQEAAKASGADKRIATLPSRHAGSSGMCMYIGPFAEKISAKQVALKLGERASSLPIQLRKEEVEPLYWVYYPPLGNAQLALRKLREFQSQQIDSFLVTKGEYANAISLGYFSKKASAVSVRNNIEEVGYDARMIMRKRYKEQFWIGLDQLTLAVVGPDKISQASRDYPEVSLQKKLCKTVASK